jgi:sarcosine oxidase
MDSTEIVVVGGGVMGLATARALARQGRDVVVLEQFRVGHKRGSSHGRSRIVRLAYPEADWVRLAQEAMAGWRALERETGETLVQLTGFAELVDDPAASSRDALEACGAAWELLQPEEFVRRFDVRVPDAWVAVLQPEAGFVHADRAQAAFRAAAERDGARIHEEAPVRSLDALDAETIVVTAGSWARPLLEEAGIELPVVPTRETVAFFRLERDSPPPAVVAIMHGGHGFYSLFDPEYGLKVGRHHSGPVADPDEEGAPDPEIVEAVTEWANRTYALDASEPAAVETCLYTNTDDERFVLERHGRIVVGSACSGHGFKFAPAVGERLAGLAMT